MFSSFSATALTIAGILASEEGIAPDGSEPIGWLAGGFTLVFTIAGVLLMWSFVRTHRKAREMWAEREAAEGAQNDDPTADGGDKPADS